jgi:2-polyprenyl-6-methoxyphenol hydroxylase-like FAD-dependent oxidoreductase
MKDPITGQGIGDGFRDAELLTEALDQALSGRRAEGEALAEYARRRDAQSLANYEYTCQRADLEQPAPPQLRRLVAALRSNQEATDRFAGVIVGTVSAQEYFAPENVQQILAVA